MNILIDTHIFLWLIFEPQKISRHHMSYLEDLDNAIYLSAISIAEIMIKKSIGMLDVEFDLFDIIDDMGLLMLDFDVSSALYLGTLPFHHRDPFDRMLISQSLSHKYKIISVDSKFTHYPCELL